MPKGKRIKTNNIMNELEKVKANLAEQTNNTPTMTFESSVSTVMRKVYLWMTFALVISGLSAWMVASNPTLLAAVLGNMSLLIVLMVVEIALVIGISAGINRLSPTTATLLFILYSIINGVTLSFIFVAYTMTSIASVFFITAGTFAAMAVVGYTTKKDLSGWGRFLLMALIGLIIASVVNIFVASEGLYMLLNYVGVLIFVALTAYDTQAIKRMLQEADGNEEVMQKIGIIGALTLYLDFINLFIKLLAIFGNRD